MFDELIDYADSGPFNFFFFYFFWVFPFGLLQDRERGAKERED